MAMSRFKSVNRLRLIIAILFVAANIVAVVLSRGEKYPTHIHPSGVQWVVLLGGTFPRFALLAISFFLWRDKLDSRTWLLLAGAGALAYIAEWIISIDLYIPGMVWFTPATIFVNLILGLIYAFALTRRLGPVVYGD